MLDAFAIFADKDDLTGAQYGNGVVGSVPATHSYDTFAAGTPAAAGPGGTIGGPLLHDIGRGDMKLYYYNQIETAVTSLGGATVEIDFVCADDEALTVNLTVVERSDAIAKATLVIGFRYPFGTIPKKVPRRFIGTQVVIGTANLTAGGLTSALVTDMEDHAAVFGS